MRRFISWRSVSTGRFPSIVVLAFILGTLQLARPAAAINLSETVQLHGYASQAYFLTDENRFFGSSDRGSFDFREVGANLSWQARPYLQFAAQVNYRKAGETEKDTPRVDYALVDVTFYSDSGDRAGLRAGRHKNAFGLYNQTRDVANTRPSILLPESIYMDTARNIVLSLDGAQLYGEHRSDVGDFFLDVGAGDLVLDKETRESLKSGTTYMGRLLYEFEGGRYRVALTGAEANLLSNLSFAPDAKLVYSTYILSAQWNLEKGSLTGEFQPDQSTTVTNGGPIMQNGTGRGMSYYLQGQYRFAKDWDALVRYDALYTDKNDLSGGSFAAATGLPAYSRFARDWTIGLGWNIMRGTLLRAEWHSVDGTAWLSSRENPSLGDAKRRWNLFALQASYSF